MALTLKHRRHRRAAELPRRPAASGAAPGAPKLSRGLGLVGAVLLTLSLSDGPPSSLFVIVPGLFRHPGQPAPR